MKYLKQLNKEKGVAGIEVLIEIVIGLFILGVLVFCITLMGSEIQDQDSLYDTVSATLTNATSVSTVNSFRTTYFTGAPPESRSCGLVVSYVWNASSGTAIPSSNYTITGCDVLYSGGSDAGYGFNGSLWNLTGSWNYQTGADSVLIINDTYQSVGEVVDWFPIIIIFGAIVVLILLTVLIIRTVRGTGYGGGGGFGRETA